MLQKNQSAAVRPILGPVKLLLGGFCFFAAKKRSGSEKKAFLGKKSVGDNCNRRGGALNATES